MARNVIPFFAPVFRAFTVTVALCTLLYAQIASPLPPVLQLSPDQARQVDRWMATLSVRQKAAQLLVVNFYGNFPAIGSDREQYFRDLVERESIGGLIVLNRVVEGSVQRAEPYEMAAFLNHMQRAATIPLWVAGDFERSASMRMNGTAVFPHAMAFGAAGDPNLTRRFGAATACESRALGVHWVLAPSADVNSDPANPVIHLRSFGESPEAVSQHVVAFLEGVQQTPECPALATVKHFPGHGDTSVDSHYALPVINQSREELERIDLAPFRAAIQAGVAGVMPGHLRVPALDTENPAATVSPVIATDLLRKQMNFSGLISTDALDMRGITALFDPGEATIRAFEAGADVLMIPTDPKVSIDAIEQAVHSGRISQDRLNESVRRILSAKAKLGLHNQRLVEIESIARVIPSPAYRDLALEVARKAITPLRNRRNAVPLSPQSDLCTIVLNRSHFTTDGRILRRSIQAIQPNARFWFVDEMMSDQALAQVQREAVRCKNVAVASFVSISGFPPGEVPLPARQIALARAIEASPARMILIPFTNPYLASHFPKASAILVPFSNVTTAEQAVAEALFGQFPLTGRTPVTIPGVVDSLDEPDPSAMQ